MLAMNLYNKIYPNKEIRLWKPSSPTAGTTRT